MESVNYFMCRSTVEREETYVQLNKYTEKFIDPSNIKLKMKLNWSFRLQWHCTGWGVLSKKDTRKITWAEMKFLTAIDRLYTRDRTSNKHIRQVLQIFNLENKIDESTSIDATI